MRTYYTLVEREEPGTPWYIQFGDYDRETVEAEMEEFRDKGFRAKNLKIVRSGDKQAEVEAAVARLNGEPIFDRRNADRIDGYDRDDLGESPDY